jgi:hypothetical protein
MYKNLPGFFRSSTNNNIVAARNSKETIGLTKLKIGASCSFATTASSLLVGPFLRLSSWPTISRRLAGFR